MNRQDKELILIVDDEIINIELMKNILEQKYSVISSSNGKSAIENAIEYRPDLILLDILMPEMDGIEVFNRLKKNQQTSNIPVIFLTSKNTEKDEAEALENGAVDYIVKPFKPTAGMQRVAKHIELGRKLTTLPYIEDDNGEKYFDIGQHLKQHYNLTDAESRLTNGLVNGLSLEQISTDSGLKYNTLKGYLKVVFQKTNTKKQHELVSQVLKSFVSH